MLIGAAARAAADLLARRRRASRQIADLPGPLRPGTRAEAYRIQTALEAHSRHPVAGWKIAATSAAGQAHINVDGPLAGRIFREGLLENGDTVPLAGNNMRVAELEFAFRLGRDLPPRKGGYTMDEVRAAVASLHPAIEIPASRYTDFCAVGAAALIADNSCALAFLIGPAFDPGDWRDRDLAAWTVTAHVDGRGDTHGIGANVLGDPWRALHWLVNECAAHGMALADGQVISTGTCLVPVPVEPGDVLTTDYGAGEALTLRFA